MLTHLNESLERLSKLVQEVDSQASQLPISHTETEAATDTASAAKQLLQELDGAEAEWPKLAQAVSGLEKLLESSEPTRQAHELARLQAESERLRADLKRRAQRGREEAVEAERAAGAAAAGADETQEHWARGFPQTEPWRRFLELHSALAKWLQGTDLDMQVADPEALDVQQITEAANKLRVRKPTHSIHTCLQ